MKRYHIMILILLVFLLVPIANSPTYAKTSESPTSDNTLASFAGNQHKAEDAFGYGVGAITETGDYTDTWFNDGSFYYVADSAYITMALMMQLDQLQIGDSLTFFTYIRVKASNNNHFYWGIGEADGTFIIEHNSEYSYYGIDSSWIEVSFTVEVDTAIIEAQNETGHIALLVSAAGIYTYHIYCAFAYIELHGTYDFKETISDDYYFTPDPSQFTPLYGYGEGYGAFTENNDYTDTQINDGTYWYLSDSLVIYMNMFMQLPDLSKFDVIVFHADWRATCSSSDKVVWAIGDGSGTTIIEYNNIYEYVGTDSGYETHHETIMIDATLIEAQNETGYLTFKMTGAGIYTYGIYCDWAYIELYRNDTCFVESFADVSDFDDSLYDDAQNTITSDGDIGTFTGTGDITDDNEYLGSNAPSVTINGLYHYEISYKMQDTNADYARLYLYDAASHSGNYQSITLYEVTTWTTVKGLITLSAVESYLISLQRDTGVTTELYIDDFNIFSATACGWQHDASTKSGVVETGSGLTYETTSDSDVLTMNVTYDSSPNTGQFQFPFDTSTTDRDIERDYYGFLRVRVKATETGSTDPRFGVRLDAVRSDSISISSTWTTYDINLMALTTANANRYFYLAASIGAGESCEFELDFIKIHSIANFGITESSTTVDDVLYVEHGVLNAEMDTGHFILDYEGLYKNTTDSLTWNKSTSNGDSYVSFGYDGWSEYSSETTGSLYGGTLTDLHIKFNETANIIDITFESLPPEWHVFNDEGITFMLDLPDWVTCPYVSFYIYIPINQATIDYVLMYVGLLLIPVSTLYLVWGGKEKMSTDKLLIFLLIFFTGVGLLLGGLLL